MKDKPTFLGVFACELKNEPFSISLQLKLLRLQLSQPMVSEGYYHFWAAIASPSAQATI